MVTRKKNTGGFIAILSLLVVATISMVIAMTVLKSGVNNASLSISSIDYENARISANICLEDTLLRIKREAEFSENLNYQIDANHSCTTDINWHTPESPIPGITETLVDLATTGTSQNFTRTFNYGLKVKQFTVNHNDGSVDYLNNINIISIEELNG